MAASRVGIKIGVRSLVVYALDHERVLQRRAPLQGVTVRMLTEADMDAYLGLHPDGEESAAARFAIGDRCVAAWRNGRVVGSRWVTSATADLGWGISFPLHPGIAYAYDAFTAPGERGRGIGGAVTAELIKNAAGAGATQVINAVDPSNPQGQGLARGRSDAIGMMRSASFGPWLIVRCRLPLGYLRAPLPWGAHAADMNSQGVSSTTALHEYPTDSR